MDSKLSGNRITSLYIGLMLSFFILFTGFDGYVRIAMKKYLCFAALTLLWLILLLAFEGNKIKSILRAGLWKKCPAVWIGVIFCLSCSLSTCLSEYPELTGFDSGRYDGLFTYLLYVAVFLGVYLTGELKEIHLLLFFGAYGICCLVILLQLAGFNPLWLYPGQYNYYDPNIREIYMMVGTVGNEDLASSLNCLALPMGCCLMNRVHGKWRILVIISMVLGLACAAFSGADGTVLALGLTAVLGLPLAVACKNGGGKKPYGLAAAAIALMFLLALLAVLLIPAGQGTLWELKELLCGRIDDSFGSHRVMIWKSALQAFKEHPLFGIGPCCFSQYNDISFQRYSQALGRTLTVCVDNAHNEFLQYLLSFGLAGLGAPAAGLALVFRKKRHSALYPAIFCYLVQAFFNLGLPIVTPIFLILCALSVKEAHFL